MSRGTDSCARERSVAWNGVARGRSSPRRRLLQPLRGRCRNRVSGPGRSTRRGESGRPTLWRTDRPDDGPRDFARRTPRMPTAVPSAPRGRPLTGHVALQHQFAIAAAGSARHVLVHGRHPSGKVRTRRHGCLIKVEPWHGRRENQSTENNDGDTQTNRALAAAPESNRGRNRTQGFRSRQDQRLLRPPSHETIHFSEDRNAASPSPLVARRPGFGHRSRRSPVCHRARDRRPRRGAGHSGRRRGRPDARPATTLRCPALRARAQLAHRAAGAGAAVQRGQSRLRDRGLPHLGGLRPRPARRHQRRGPGRRLPRPPGRRRRGRRTLHLHPAGAAQPGLRAAGRGGRQRGGQLRHPGQRPQRAHSQPRPLRRPGPSDRADPLLRHRPEAAGQHRPGRGHVRQQRSAR